jgi:hypothetical protein
MGYRSLAELTADRRRDVTTAHKLVGSGLRDLLAELYPDNAHFIYELLQNAEDARATEVDFDLKKGRLDFTHDGTEAFTLDNIEAITAIGYSTKRADDTTIGKFGVGFKAVFSYTNRPMVRSGQYAFEIQDLFVPEPVEAPSPGDKTVFTFPFDRKEKPREVAYEEVARGLRALTETTLLFLRNIHTIRYQLADGTFGRIERTDADYPFVRIEYEADGLRAESHWLRLVGGRSLSKLIPEEQTVAAAFRLDGEPGKGKPAKGKLRSARVTPLQRGETCVYFPAVKETSGLRFHIHAPFAPTPARDSIKNISDNGKLVDAIGRLIAAALPGLRDDGWLSDEFLEALPNADDALAAPYTAIHNRIHEAFHAKALTPVIGDRYAKASALVSSPSEFRTALDTEDLKFLTRVLGDGYPESPRWIPQRSGRAGRFLAGLGVKPFGWSELDDVLDVVNRDGGSLAMAWRIWLLIKPTERLKAFYELIGQGVTEDKFDKTWRRFLFTEPLIRVRNGDTAEVASAAHAYLPSSPEDSADGRVPTALAYFDSDEETKSKRRLAAFYQAVGVRRWDEQAQVEARLAAYQPGSMPTVQQSLDDMRGFIAYLKSRPQDDHLFRGVSFFLGQKPGSPDQYWTRPTQLYIDTPYRATGLAKIHGDRFRLSAIYMDAVEGIEEFAAKLGATTALSPSHVNVWDNKEYKSSWYSSRWTSQGIRRDWDLPELPTILNSKDSALLGTLWQFMIETPEHYRNATFQVNGSAPRYVLLSQLAQRLIDVPWVLDQSGKLRTAESMTIEELPEGWPEPPQGSLAMALGFGKESRERGEAALERRRRARDAGISVEFLDILDGLPEDECAPFLTKYMRERATFEAEFIARNKARNTFPVSAPANPERRAAIVAADARDAPEFETEKRERSIVIGRSVTSGRTKQYLREEYTNEDGNLYCQGCHQPMPFKYSGDWYFEAVQFIPKRAKTHDQNALALCPLCAALYKYALGTSEDVLLASMLEVEVTAETRQVPLPILLNGKPVELRFTRNHALDLRSALKEAGAKRSKK